jgi:hypothetical protein
MSRSTSALHAREPVSLDIDPVSVSPKRELKIDGGGHFDDGRLPQSDRYKRCSHVFGPFMDSRAGTALTSSADRARSIR